MYIVNRGVRQLSALHESFDFTALSSENPLSLSGRVTNGLATGGDWHNLQLINGRGVTGTASQSPPPYADNIGTIAPPSGANAWASNQELISRIGVRNQGTFGGFHEVEHLLRFKISANVARGYEVIYSVGPTAYFEIVLWKGTVSQFQSLAKNDTTAPLVQNGHYVRATIVESVIRAYHKTTLGGSWTQYVSYDISNDLSLYGFKWTHGDVGMGNWDNGAGNYDDYCHETLDIAA